MPSAHAHLELAIAGGAQIPLGGLLRALGPATGGLRLRDSGANLARTGLIAEGTLGYWQAKGTTPGVNATLDVVTRELVADLAIGYRLRVARAWRLDGLIAAGGIWYRREFSPPGFSGSEGTLAPVAGLRLRGVLAPGSWPVFVAPCIDGALTWPTLAGRAHVSGQVALGLEVGLKP